CNICSCQVTPQDRQNHMGRHILHALKLVPQDGECPGEVSLEYPCGFCGQSSINGACFVSIKSGKVLSRCKYEYSLQISATSRVSKSKPCTNVPMKCSI
ncbi:hypothetical protein FA15DRAFT_553474, partial [Coprinopsis marcescibilis]